MVIGCLFFVLPWCCWVQLQNDGNRESRAWFQSNFKQLQCVSRYILIMLSFL